MKKIGLPALVVALGLVLFAVVRLTRPAPPPAVQPGTAAPAAPVPAPASELAPSVLDRPDAPTAEVAREGLPAAATAERGLETWDLARSIWVEGTVRAPDGCADEGPVEVLATTESLDADALARALEHKDTTAILLSRRKVGTDGAFRIPFPPDARRGHVSLRGRYWFLPESVPVDLVAGARSLVLEPRCGAWITGTVVLPAESPVAPADLDGLEVEMRSSMENFSGPVAGLRGFHRTTRLAAGAFEFRAIPADSGGSLETEPKRLAAAALKLDKLDAGRENPVHLDLLRGGTVRGIVRDTAGAAVAGAKVEAARPGQWFGFDNKTVREGESSGDGAFELAAVAPGRVVLSASRDGYLESERTKIELQDGGLASGVELALSRGSTVSGTLAWPEGKPAVSVEVTATFDMSQLFGMGAFNAMRGREGKATTDEQGAFTINGLGEGPFTLAAQAPPPGQTAGKKDGPEGGEEDAAKTKKTTWWRARTDGVHPGTKDLALVLRAPEGIAGRVVDEKGQPVPKFRIQAVRDGKGPMGNFGQEERKDSFEDAEGRFLLAGLIEGTWKLYAVADGFGLPEPVSIEIPRKTDAPELVIALEHAASVAGVVKSPAGQLVAGATVGIDTGEPPWKAMIQSGPKPPKATSDVDGTFVLDGLRAGKVRLVAASKEWAKSLPLELDLTAGQRVDGAELVLREGGVLTGEVFGEGGRPATGMFVQATQMKDFDSQMTFVGGKGEFRIEHLLPGSWQVVAMPSRGEPDASADGGKDGAEGAMAMISKMKTAVVSIAEGEETHVVLGAPPRDPVEVHGQVTHAGEPCVGAMVAFVAEGKDAMKGMKTCQVAKDGGYTVKLDAPGFYDISVQKLSGGMAQQSTVEFAREIPEGKEYKLDLAMPTARISGRITGPDGAPAAGARVSLHPESPVEAGTMWGGQYHEGATDSDGHYDIQMLRPGTYTLGAGGTALGGIFGEEAAFGRELRGGLRLSDGEWMRDVDFRLKKPGTLDVVVVDAGGAPAGEASVFVRDAGGRLVDGLSMVATDAGGKARYPGLAPGTYTVSARKELLTSVDSPRVRVEEGGRAQAQIALQPGTVLVVTCLGDESKPVHASISVQDEEGREVGAMISLSEVMKMFGENGFSTTERRIGPLPQGKYKVRATGPDGKVINKPVSLTGQAERKITLHFD